MGKHQVVVIAALFVVTGLLVVGCGDDDGDASSGSPGTETTKAAFIVQADEVCAESKQRVIGQGTQFFKKAEEQQQGRSDDATQEEMAEVVFAPEYERTAAELAELEVPSNDNGEAAAFVASYQEFSDSVSADPPSFFEEDGVSIQNYRATKRLAKEYGLKKCP